MHARALTLVALAGVAAIVVTQLGTQPATGPAHAANVSVHGPVIGPDVIVSKLESIALWGNSGDIGGYSISTTSCNIGDELLEWLDYVPGTNDELNRHPVIAQNFYRLKDGRFEQIGMSWVKHGFYAADANEPLGACLGCTPVNDGDYLYPGCSDTYSTVNNGSQYWLGPRSEINATTGEYPYPHFLHWRTTSSDPTFKRLQVHNDDLDPAMNAGARYYAESEYISVDEQPWGTDDNNSSWREFTVNGPLSGGFDLSYIGTIDTIRQEEYGVQAWKEADANVEIVIVDIPNDGRVVIGYLVTDNLDGTWTYEYAINNYNSDRSICRVSVPVECSVITGIGFHDVDYHSGEPFDGTDWPGAESANVVTWETTEDFATNPNANALRWGTLYNYRFTSDLPPTAGDLELGLFKPGEIGDPDSVPATVMVPRRPCPADIVGGNTVNVSDLLQVLSGWGGAGIADITGSDGCPDGIVNVTDLLRVLADWGPCP